MTRITGEAPLHDDTDWGFSSSWWWWLGMLLFMRRTTKDSPLNDDGNWGCSSSWEESLGMLPFMMIVTGDALLHDDSDWRCFKFFRRIWLVSCLAALQPLVCEWDCDNDFRLYRYMLVLLFLTSSGFYRFFCLFFLPIKIHSKHIPIFFPIKFGWNSSLTCRSLFTL